MQIISQAFLKSVHTQCHHEEEDTENEKRGSKIALPINVKRSFRLQKYLTRNKLSRSMKSVEQKKEVTTPDDECYWVEVVCELRAPIVWIL